MFYAIIISKRFIFIAIKLSDNIISQIFSNPDINNLLNIKQNYRMSLKDMCLNLLTQLTINETEDAELVLIFNDPELDAIARIITYGNGVISRWRNS